MVISSNDKQALYTKSPLYVEQTAQHKRNSCVTSERMMAKSYIQENFGYDISQLDDLEPNRPITLGNVALKESSSISHIELRITDTVSPATSQADKAHLKAAESRSQTMTIDMERIA